jgi:hypothetical protein
VRRVKVGRLKVRRWKVIRWKVSGRVGRRGMGKWQMS